MIDIFGCQAALFEWAESYDSKDWDRLSKCIAPVLRVGPFEVHSPTMRLLSSESLLPNPDMTV